MNNTHKNPYLWVQLVLLGALACFLIAGFLSGGIHSSAQFADVEAGVLSVLDRTAYPRQDAQKLRRYLGLDPSLTLNVSFYRLDDAMSARELVLVEFDPASREAIQSAVEARRSSQEQIYEGYAPEQAQQMKDALIDFQENYALYYVGNDPLEVDSAFRQALKGKS